MKLNQIFIGLAAVCLIGCGSSGDDILKQQKAANKMPPPSREQLQKGFAEIAAGRAGADKANDAWAKANPDKVAAYNAAMAMRGAPPIK